MDYLHTWRNHSDFLVDFVSVHKLLYLHVLTADAANHFLKFLLTETILISLSNIERCYMKIFGVVHGSLFFLGGGGIWDPFLDGWSHSEIATQTKSVIFIKII